MAYVDDVYFASQYVGSVEIDDDDFVSLAERASDVIDDLTQYTVKRNGIESLCEFDATQFKRAVCAQIEHLYYQGIENAVSGGSSGSYNIGSTSITKAVGSDSSVGGAGARVSPLAIRLLAPTGLLYRGVDLC